MKICWTRVLQVIVMVCLLQLAYAALRATPFHSFLLTFMFSTLFFFMVGPLTEQDETDTGDDL
jgi:hypothetical protein